LIDILGADHHGYVPRMKASIAALGHPENSFHAIVHQLILLFRGKEPVKMSKRSGEFVRLKEVIDEVGKDACRFFFAQRTPNSHLNFDLELAKKRTSENPVYYCQYVHARICSIFDEAKMQGIFEGKGNNPSSRIITPFLEMLRHALALRARNAVGTPDCGLISTLEERALLVKMAWFPEVLKTVQKELSPHPLANYILELAGLFHPFYEKCRVVDPVNLELSRARLYLCAGVRALIKEGLGLIGVSAPEKM
jgi:arginyl-tRNA synthetase